MIAPATPSPSADVLAERIFALDGVARVFLGADFITVTKGDDADWQTLRPQVLGAVMEHFMANLPVIEGLGEEGVEDFDPADAEAVAGLAMAKVLQRTQGVDLNEARAAAAAAPDDVDAQTLVAYLDMLGGHVDDSFARLVDVVRRTAGDDRTKARDHLLGLRRFGQHGFLGLNLLPDLLGDEIHVTGGGSRGLRVRGPDHPAAKKIHQTGVAGFRGQRWVTSGTEPQE